MNSVHLCAGTVQTGHEASPDQPVILLVDDEASIVLAMRLVLERDGWFVLSAEDGAEGLELSRRFRGSIDAALLDIVMPGMDGLTLREHLTRERPATKVVLMSAQVSSPVKDCPFLRKPFAIGVLKQRLRQLVQR